MLPVHINSAKSHVQVKMTPSTNHNRDGVWLARTKLCHYVLTCFPRNTVGKAADFPRCYPVSYTHLLTKYCNPVSLNEKTLLNCKVGLLTFSVHAAIKQISIYTHTHTQDESCRALNCQLLIFITSHLLMV